MHTILVVEDEKIVRTMLCDMLRKHGYQTIEAEDGLEGLNLVECENVSMVVLDLIMPNYDGVSFLNLLASCHSDIKILCVTSISIDHPMYREAVKIVGEDRIIHKTNIKDLIVKVKNILG